MAQQTTIAPIGIDLGSWTSKIGVAKRGGVEVITNQANFRQTPCVVGYGKAERMIGQAGNIKIKSNFRDTVVSPMRFLGLPSTYPMLRTETKYCPAKSNIQNNKLKFQVNYQGQKQQLLPEQVSAAYLNKLKLIIQKNNFDNKSAIIAVPTYLTQGERKAFLDASKIAELNVIRLINDSTAIALDYGMFRKNDLHEKDSRNVLFIDFGHSKLSLFTCSFTKTEMNVLHQQHVRHLGCRDIDYILLQFYRGVFEKSSGEDLMQSRKAVVKIMENIQKQRKILSGILEHEINVQYLVDQNDLQFSMKRTQFEQIITPIMKIIGDVFTKVANQLGEKKITLHSIQLIGGGTRIPAFISLIKNIFKIQPSRTLNSNQSVARGCALMAAIKSPLFMVHDYGLNEAVYYGVKFYWNFVEGNKYLGKNTELYPPKQGKMIYQVGARIPTSKTIKFTRKQAIEILIEYQPIIPGFQKFIGYYVTKPQNPKQNSFGVTFKIKFTEDGLITFEDCSLVEEWTEQTKVPKPKKKVEKKIQSKKQQKKDQNGMKDQNDKKDQNKDQKKDQKKDQNKNKNQEPVAQKKTQQKMEEQAQQFQIKKSKKQKFTNIKYDLEQVNNHTVKEIQKFFAIQSTMLNQDNLIIQTYERKNQLQSLAYNWKQKLLSSHRQFIKQQQIEPIIKILQQNSQWLYGDGQNSSRGIYTERCDLIKSKIGPVQKKYDTFEAIKQELISLINCMKYNFDYLNSLDKKYQHITPEERDQGLQLISTVQSWIKNAEEKQINSPKWKESVISVKDIKDKAKEINQKTHKVMSKPVPKPQVPTKQPQNAPAQSKQPMEIQKNPPKQNNAGQKMDVE